MTLKCPIGQATQYLVCMVVVETEDRLYKHLIEDHSNIRIARALAHLVAQQAGKKATKKPAKEEKDPPLSRLENMEEPSEDTSTKIKELRNEVLEAMARLEQMDIEG